MDIDLWTGRKSTVTTETLRLRQRDSKLWSARLAAGGSGHSGSGGTVSLFLYGADVAEGVIKDVSICVIFDFDSVRSFKTLNEVQARGGSFDGPGPALAGGQPGNVLLAFSVDGR